MSLLIMILVLASSAVVVVRCVCVASTMSRRDWAGHPLRFAGAAAGYSLMCAGAVGMVLGFSHAPAMLLIGLACWILFERSRW